MTWKWSVQLRGNVLSLSSVADVAWCCGVRNCFWPAIRAETRGNTRRVCWAPTLAECGTHAPTEDETPAGEIANGLVVHIHG